MVGAYKYIDMATNMYRRFGFFGGNLRLDPRCPEGILKIPRARRVARGIFKIPDGLRGFVAKIPEQKTRILCIFFSNDFTSTTNHSANNPPSQK